MLTLYHAPLSRSTRIVQLLDELGALEQVEIQLVTIRRQDGTGGADPANPHPEGKVPLLVHDGLEIWESAAIILYLTELFPDAALGVPPGAPGRGRYLSWLAWYGDVVEPLMVLGYSGLNHPVFEITYRGLDQVADRLDTALAAAPYLMGDSYTAADLLLASPFTWMPEATPERPAIRDWVARCSARPSFERAARFDGEQTAS